MSIEDVLKKYKTQKTGLSTEEALKRLETNGRNELVEEEKDGPVKLFLSQFTDILIVMLIIAAIISYTIGNVIDATVILLVVILNSTIGFIQEYRAEKAMEQLKSLVSSEAVVYRDGKKIEIPAPELTIGDIVVIDEGDKVPADLRLIEVAELRIDESSLTGESAPVSKYADKKRVEEKKDLIAYMDSNVVSGRGLGVVASIGMDTSIGKIAEMIQTEPADTPLQAKIAHLGKILGLIALVVCTLVFILQTLKGTPWTESFMVAVSLAVAAVPEGLPAILTLTLALGMQRMAKSNAIVRRLLAVETLGSCNIICTDKTGTLTHNVMTVRESDLFDKDKSMKICALCNNSVIKDGKTIGDPTDGALMMYSDENDYSREKLNEEYPRIKEVPLDSTRKRMTTVHEYDDKRLILTKGAPELIINLCSYIEKDGKIQAITDSDKEYVLNKLNEMTNSALRVLALAYREMNDSENIDDGELLEKDLIYVGLVGMMDPPRKEAQEAIAKCNNASVKVVMITGDHQDTAAAIGKELEMLEKNSKVLTGAELEKIDDGEFEKIIDDVQVYARVFPEQKVRIVEMLQKKGNVVAMTGDGVNDAPALKKASIGVSMGSGTDVAKESAEMILQDDNFATIVSAIEEGRTIFDNIRRFIRFQLTTNVGAILTILSASLMSIPIPFNPLQILWINIIMDGPPAQSLGVEPPEENIMERGPENEDILSKNNLIKVAIAGIVMAVGTLGLYLYYLPVGSIKAMTVAFTVFVIYQLFNAFNRKNKHNWENKVFIIAIGLSLVLQLLVVYLPFLQGIFRTTALGLMDWVLIVLIAATIFLSDWICEKLIK